MGNGRVYVVGHRSPDTDTVCSAIAYAHLKQRLGETNVVPARAGELDAETAFVLERFGVPVPVLLHDATGLDLVLVDHSEVGQALPHIERANVLEVWEHHRIGDLRLPKPIFFHCEPVGATATLIGELFFVRGVTPTAAMAGILLASILSDTVLFRSPTVTPKDRDVAARLAPLAGVDPTRFGEQLLAVKATGSERKSTADILRGDYKEFDFGEGQRVGIGQVQVMAAGALLRRKAELLGAMDALRRDEGLVQVILMITDVTSEASDLLFVGARPELFERAFGQLRDGAVHLPGCMSRKKQVVPALEKSFLEAAPPQT